MALAYDPNYDIFQEQRSQLQNQANVAQQKQLMAMKRNLARQGRLGSGSSDKLTQQINEDIGGQVQIGNRAIDAAQQQEGRRRSEIKDSQEFQAGQTKAGQEFSSKESALGRSFQEGLTKKGMDLQTLLAQKSQDFTGSQNLLAREFQGELAKKGMDLQTQLSDKAQAFAGEQSKLGRDQQASQFTVGQENAQKNFLSQMQLANASYELEKEATAFNINLARAQAGKPTDILGSMLGPTFSTQGNTLGMIGAVGGGILGGGATGGIGAGWGATLGYGVGSVVNNIVGGGSVICTELHRVGLMDDETYHLDELFGARLQDHILDGYRCWANPVVKLMQKSKLFTKIVSIPALKWADSMAGKPNFIGDMILIGGLQLCSFIGIVRLNYKKMGRQYGSNK